LTRPRRAILLAALAALALFAGLGTAVARGSAIAFDPAVRDFVHGFASPPLTALARALSEVGSPNSLQMLGVGVLIAFLALGWRRAALRFVLTIAGALILDATLKALFHRARPVPFFGTAPPASYGFPSGHALFCTCFFGALAALVAAHTQNRAARGALWGTAAVLALAIGTSRIYLGVHYPSDVAAGYAVAAMWLAAVALVMPQE
jgi:undecaprenyl-diphosphatase